MLELRTGSERWICHRLLALFDSWHESKLNLPWLSLSAAAAWMEADRLFIRLELLSWGARCTLTCYPCCNQPHLSSSASLKQAHMQSSFCACVDSVLPPDSRLRMLLLVISLWASWVIQKKTLNASSRSRTAEKWWFLTDYAAASWCTKGWWMGRRWST